MKRVERSGVFRLPMMRLYREDIEELYGIFTSLSTDPIRFIVGDFEIDNLGELEQLNEQEYCSFEMDVFGPHISLTVKPDSAYIYIENRNDPVQLGVKAKIEGIVEKRRLRLGRKPIQAIFMIAGFFIGFSVPLQLSGKLENPMIFLGLMLVAATTLSIAIALTRYFDSRYGVFYLARKRERPGFMTRNRDQIIVTVLAGTLLMIVSFLLGRAVG